MKKLIIYITFILVSSFCYAQVEDNCGPYLNTNGMPVVVSTNPAAPFNPDYLPDSAFENHFEWFGTRAFTCLGFQPIHSNTKTLNT